MHISVWSHDSNPSIDRRSFRRSRHYCQTEVSEGRACQLDTDDIRRGIQLLPPKEKKHKTDPRASREASNCLTAHESKLNSEYFGNRTDVTLLAFDYEREWDKHQARGWKGTSRSCGVIAARVKTILSDPAYAG